jgi:hypothetical protein
MPQPLFCVEHTVVVTLCHACPEFRDCLIGALACASQNVRFVLDRS